MKFWEDLNPKNRRLVVIGGAVAVFAGVVAILPGGSDRDRSQRPDEPVRAILTDRQSEDVRFETLVGQLQNIRDENRALHNDLDRMRRDMERMETGELGPRLKREIDQLNEQIQELAHTSRRDGAPRRPSQVGEDGEIIVGDDPEAEINEDGVRVMDEPVQAGGQSTPSSSVQHAQETVSPSADMWNRPPPTPPAPVETGGRGRQAEPQAEKSSSSMRVIVAEKTVEEIAEEKEEGIYLPAGSILSGVLITGMDAPTGRNSRSEPFPALLRIQHEAILPNRYRADVRECFVIVGGYGDLSSERAYLRGETISCVLSDDRVVESRLNSYTVGEDGKAGLRGRLVSKQGQMLAKSMTAGVLEGFASAFNRAPVPTLSLDASSTPLYQQAFSGDALQSGAVTGVGKALDRLAQFYIDQAEGMFPVIEIDAGRNVEIVITTGGNLSIR